MLRRILIGALLAVLAAAFSASARAAAQVLMPNVSFQRTVQFTAHGPVVLNVLTAPRPGGLYQLKPLLSNGAILGTERVTSMQKDISGAATVAGVNGDLFNFNDGHPTGMFMQDKVLMSPPYRARASVGIAADGKLNVCRVSFFGYWQGLGQRRPLTGLNQPPRGDGTSLFTPAWGATTPKIPGVYEVVLQPFPPAVPGTDLTGVVTFDALAAAAWRSRRTARCCWRAARRSRSSRPRRFPATPILTRLILSPDWLASGVTDALGGGPVIVRNGKPVWTAGEDFLPSQLAPRNPRTAVGQRADGKIILLAVDGRRRGFSVGMTNWELAQAMVRLGAVTASALDAGGSTTMAFDGKLLNRPSDPGGERSVAESLAILYTGVYAPPPALGGRLAERRRRRRAPAALVQGGQAVERDREPARPGWRDRLHRDRRAAARHLHVLVALDRQTEGAGAARPLALGDLGHRHRRPDLVGRALLLAERHARLHDASRRARCGCGRRRAPRSSPASSSPRPRA